MADQVKLRVNDVKNEYQLIEKVGCGTYGTVFKARNRKTQEFVAFKKIQNKDVKLQADGFPITALREIDLLKKMNHPNIVKLKEIIVSKPSKRNLFRGSTFLVFQYVEHDFAGLFKNKITFSLSHIKCFMKQILEGVIYIHNERFLHRDLKSANILLSANGVVKIADFGLGRKARPDGRYTSKVVTLWYRAPELLLGAREYSSKIDSWSLGCIFVEFFIHDVLFKFQEYDQLERVLDICGGVEENLFFDPKMPEEERIKHFALYKKQLSPKPIRIFEHLTRRGVDESTAKFLAQFFQLNPFKRISAADALNHPYFKQSPLPSEPKDIPHLNVEYHEMVSRRMTEKAVYKNDSDFKYPLNKAFDGERAPYRESGRNNFNRDDRNYKDYKGWERDGNFDKDYNKDKHRDYYPRDHKDLSKDSYVSKDYSNKDYMNRKLSKDQSHSHKQAPREKEREKSREKERERDREREKERERGDRRYSPPQERSGNDSKSYKRRDHNQKQDRNRDRDKERDRDYTSRNDYKDRNYRGKQWQREKERERGRSKSIDQAAVDRDRRQREDRERRNRQRQQAERSRERERNKERQRQRQREKQKEKEKQKQKQKQKQKEKQKEEQKQRQRQRQRQRQKQRERDRERQRIKQKEFEQRQREKQIEREKERQREIQRERDRELERQKERQRQKSRNLEKFRLPNKSKSTETTLQKSSSSRTELDLKNRSKSGVVPKQKLESPVRTPPEEKQKGADDTQEKTRPVQQEHEKSKSISRDKSQIKSNDSRSAGEIRDQKESSSYEKGKNQKEDRYSRDEKKINYGSNKNQYRGPNRDYRDGRNNSSKPSDSYEIQYIASRRDDRDYRPSRQNYDRDDYRRQGRYRKDRSHSKDRNGRNNYPPYENKRNARFSRSRSAHSRSKERSRSHQKDRYHYERDRKYNSSNYQSNTYARGKPR